MLLLIFSAASSNEAAPLVIMPLGDSNTVGTANGPGAYRTRLWQNFGSDPSRMTFTGSQQSGPAELGSKLHEGHSGYTIAAAPVGFGNLTDFIGGYLDPRKRPDAILLMIGTNDMNLNYQVDQAPARLDFLISRISDLSTGLKPNAKLYVASVPPIDDARNQFRTGSDTMANERVLTFNAAIPGIVAAHRARGERVHFVDVYSELTLADIDDGLHPGAAGYAKIGDAFYRAITLPEPGGLVHLCVVIAAFIGSNRMGHGRGRG
jgi:lysophospholipase L1-like esterase